MAKAQFYTKKNPFAHTYSIVARDSITGEMGVAVQSHWFSVGPLVAWGQSGVGVVATQSFINSSFGPRGLSLLKSGIMPKAAILALLETDEGRDVRQLAILNKNGDAFAYTGKNCIDFAGHLVGQDFSVQANLMANQGVPEAMAAAFSTTTSSLAERMMAALEAAQKVGGDVRGQQSASLLVVRAVSTGNEWEDKLVDLRVDDHPNPLSELRRLLQIQTAYDFMNKGDHAIEVGKMAEAKQHYQKAQSLNPDNMEMKFWYAVTLSNNDEFVEAKTIFKLIFQKEKHWQVLVPRLVKAGLLTISKEELNALLD